MSVSIVQVGMSGWVYVVGVAGGCGAVRARGFVRCAWDMCVKDDGCEYVADCASVCNGSGRRECKPVVQHRRHVKFERTVGRIAFHSVMFSCVVGNR